MMHRLRAVATILIASLVSAGCATNYIYNGVKYTDKAGFYAAYRKEMSQNLEEVKPLAQPVSAKKLRYVLPTRDRSMSAIAKREGVRLNRTVTRDELENSPLVLLPLEDYENVAQMVQKKALYANTEITHTDSSAEPETSDTSDVVWLHVSDEVGRSGQLYFIGSRTGKQPLAVDGGLNSRFERANSLINSIKGAAIQNK